METPIYIKDTAKIVHTHEADYMHAGLQTTCSLQWRCLRLNSDGTGSGCSVETAMAQGVCSQYAELQVQFSATNA